MYKTCFHQFAFIIGSRRPAIPSAPLVQPQKHHPSYWHFFVAILEHLPNLGIYPINPRAIFRLIHLNYTINPSKDDSKWSERERKKGLGIKDEREGREEWEGCRETLLSYMASSSSASSSWKQNAELPSNSMPSDSFFERRGQHLLYTRV